MAWIERLRSAGQGWWQALPIGPTGYGDSPYQALSSFAGNGLLISPDLLIEDGLLVPAECECPPVPAAAIDYGAVTALKHGMLMPVWKHFVAGGKPELKRDFEQFCHEHAHWLDDYALFRAIKAGHNNVCYLDWPADLIRREPSALQHARRDLAELIDAIRLAQFLVFRQAKRLKEYAHSRRIRLIGDLPFFVSPDSSDVWANPQYFLLDQQRRPRCVAGVPPDYFSAKGQLWGNPQYDWDALSKDGFQWSIQRFRALLAHVDVIRLDHFRAFVAAWQIPVGAQTAESGQWVPGPGAEFFTAVKRELNGLPFIAEDLGLITPDVRALLDQFHLPGNRVLQFAFDGDLKNPHLPSNYIPNTVAYTATHDNPTTRQWFDELPQGQRQKIQGYLKQRAGGSGDIAREFIGLTWSSPAALAIVPLQDLLGLGPEGRMNQPGRPDGNWRWRCTEEMLRAPAWDWLRELTSASNRNQNS
jgi:4-alpha-glucanotransferase